MEFRKSITAFGLFRRERIGNIKATIPDDCADRKEFLKSALLAAFSSLDPSAKIDFEKRADEESKVLSLI